jgi:DNA-binding SARP family transcriptional activator
MTFEAQFHFTDTYLYGYIFRIISDRGNTADLVIGDASLVFSMPSGDIASSLSLTDAGIVPDRWISTAICADVKRGEVSLTVGEQVRRWSTPEIRDFDRVEIIFGKINNPSRQVIDVPDMTVRNLTISDPSGKPLYAWTLSMHGQQGVYDDLKYHFAKCENPLWQLDSYGEWTRVAAFGADRTPYLAYDPDRNRVAVADQYAFCAFSVQEGHLERQTVNRGLSYIMTANQMIYNPLDSSFYAYNLIRENDAREFVPFDRAEGRWGATAAHENHTDYRHHNRYFSAQHNRLYLFGGYGHLKYRDGVLIYDVGSSAWSRATLKGYTPAPRYLSGMGKVDDDHLLLFGGYGSESGDQALQAQYYYDCYIVDLRTLEARKLWTLESPAENFVVSNSLVVDTVGKSFYALCYPFMTSNTVISLYKFSLERPEYEVMAGQIPLRFKDVFSYVDLFFDRAGNRLIAATCAPGAESETDVSIYTMPYPPLKRADIYQTERVKRKFSATRPAGLLLLSALSIALLLIGKGKKGKKGRGTTGSGKAESGAEDEPLPITGISTVRKLQKQSINLFGGFQVIDRQGNDITADFKPLLKNLFLLILLNTIKNGKGISFSRLKEILWFDKSEESANNNRGVALSKIRQIMENVGKTQFNKKGTCWSVKFGEEVYCDYYEALILMKKIKENRETTLRDIKRLLTIVTVGELMPNTQADWTDTFKSDFSNELVDLILHLVRQSPAPFPFPDDTGLEMANALLTHDPLNEDGLRLKCKTLVKTGKNGLAKKTYATFSKEYALLFGIKYPYTFEQTIH